MQAEAMFRLLSSDYEPYRQSMAAEKAKLEESLRAKSRELLVKMQEAKSLMGNATDDEKAFLGKSLQEMDKEFHGITQQFVKIKQAFSLQNPWLVMMVSTERPKPEDISHQYVKSVVQNLYAQLREENDGRCTARHRVEVDSLTVTLKYQDFKELLPLHLTNRKLVEKGREDIRKWANKTGTQHFFSITPSRSRLSWTD